MSLGQLLGGLSGQVNGVPPMLTGVSNSIVPRPGVSSELGRAFHMASVPWRAAVHWAEGRGLCPWRKGWDLHTFTLRAKATPLPAQVHVASHGQALGITLPGGLGHSCPCFGWKCRKKTPLCCSHLTSYKSLRAEGRTALRRAARLVGGKLTGVQWVREVGRGVPGEARSVSLSVLLFVRPSHSLPHSPWGETSG